MITAITTVRLNATSVDRKTRDLTNDALHPQQVISGTGATWEAAVDACVIPDGAQVMHLMRG